jgi:glycosyltransferase involved in cell wall biosynthesis
VIVAAHNEADSIGATLEALVAAMVGVEILVADDASTDATREIAGRVGARVVSGRRSRGKGANVTAAAMDLVARCTDQTTVILCDADLGTSAGQLMRLAEAVEEGECELAVARFARREGGGFGVAVGYAQRKIEQLCGFRAEAPISGQRAMRAGLLRALLPFADGWGLEMGMTIDAVRAGKRLKEIELPLEHRATGRTLGGFLHRARQLRDFVRVYRSRR